MHMWQRCSAQRYGRVLYFEFFGAARCHVFRSIEHAANATCAVDICVSIYSHIFKVLCSILVSGDRPADAQLARRCMSWSRDVMVYRNSHAAPSQGRRLCFSLYRMYCRIYCQDAPRTTELHVRATKVQSPRLVSASCGIFCCSTLFLRAGEVLGETGA